MSVWYSVFGMLWCMMYVVCKTCGAFSAFGIRKNAKNKKEIEYEGISLIMAFVYIRNSFIYHVQKITLHKMYTHTLTLRIAQKKKKKNNKHMIKVPKPICTMSKPPPSQKHHPSINSKHFNQNESEKREQKKQNQMKLLTQTDSNSKFRTLNSEFRQRHEKRTTDRFVDYYRCFARATNAFFLCHLCV